MKHTLLASFAAFSTLATVSVWADETHVSVKFEGGKANRGVVTHAIQGGKR